MRMGLLYVCTIGLFVFFFTSDNIVINVWYITYSHSQM